MHQNNIFLKKIIFNISTSKQSKNTKKIISSKKKSNFGKTAFWVQCQTRPYQLQLICCKKANK
jgi:hypothetical protein